MMFAVWGKRWEEHECGYITFNTWARCCMTGGPQQGISRARSYMKEDVQKHLLLQMYEIL